MYHLKPEMIHYY